MSIQFGGIVSGLDTNNMINQLVQLKRRPIQRLQGRQRAVENQISSLGKLSSKMSELSSKAEDLGEVSGILASSAQSSNEDVLSASATGEATSGAYSVVVDSLARAEKNRSQAFGDAFSEVKSGTLELSVYGESAVSVDIAAGDALSDVRDKINASDAKVSASIIDTGSGAYLSLTAAKTGHAVGGPAADAITITETYSGTTGSELNLAETQTASNATFTVDGLSVERTSNQVSDVLEGVTIDLKQTSATPVELTVAPDPEKVIEKLEAFTEAYNSTVQALKEIREESGALARGALTELGSMVSGSVQGASSEYVNLSSIGLETVSTNGELKLDQAKLKDALADDPTAVSALFTTQTEGISDKMSTMMERYTRSGGILSSTQDGLDARASRVEDEIVDKERSVDAYESRLNQQFTRLETMMNEMNATKSRLSSYVPPV